MQISIAPLISMDLYQYRLDENLILRCFVIFSPKQQIKYVF